MLQSTDANKET